MSVGVVLVATSYPTASQRVSDEQDTPCRTFVPDPLLGDVVTVHVDPLRSSTSVTWTPSVLT
jgi:hypothetical protein